MACFMCEPELHEWQQVWDGREELHHMLPPVPQGRYRGHTCKWDLSSNALQMSVTPGGQVVRA